MKGEKGSEGEKMEKSEREIMGKTENGGLATEQTEINQWNPRAGYES